jgi:hypothetical protein
LIDSLAPARLTLKGCAAAQSIPADLSAMYCPRDSALHWSEAIFAEPGLPG